MQEEVLVGGMPRGAETGSEGMSDSRDASTAAGGGGGGGCCVFFSP